ncbi:hypothetical protein IT575_12090 [bacterium]|nr:hypothetical protein [bacterium]
MAASYVQWLALVEELDLVPAGQLKELPRGMRSELWTCVQARTADGQRAVFEQVDGTSRLNSERLAQRSLKLDEIPEPPGQAPRVSAPTPSPGPAVRRTRAIPMPSPTAATPPPGFYPAPKPDRTKEKKMPRGVPGSGQSAKSPPRPKQQTSQQLLQQTRSALETTQTRMKKLREELKELEHEADVLKQILPTLEKLVKPATETGGG